MKRLLFAGMIIMISALCSVNGFSAAYDATGTWDYSTTGNWVNPGNSDCTADSNETGVAYVTQNGDSISVVVKGATYTGTVSGSDCSVSGSYSEDGGTTTVNVNFRLSSSTSASGTTTWSWTDGYYYCNGGANISMTKRLDASGGNLVTSDLWIKAVINTVEKGPIEAVWQKGGEDTTSRGDHVIWGHFYASPSDVTWGSENNPDLFVKIWFDVSGRVDVNYFHVSVPDIEVYSDYPYDGTADEQGTTTMSRRYIRQYYEGSQSYSEENYEDGNPPSGYSPVGNPSGYSTINDLRIGGIINTVEKGPIDAVWRFGGQDTTSRGDQVVWGHFYASPSDVTWGSQNNPDLFVKIWFDAGGRIDVNYFHVSVPDIEIYSDYPENNTYDKMGTTILSDRYIRHEFQRGTTNEQSWNIVGTWYATRIDGSLDPEGNPLEVTGDVSTWVFNNDGTYSWFLHAPPYYYLDDTGTYTYKNERIVLNGMVSVLPAKGYIECPINSRSFTFLDDDNDRWIYELNE